jgi:glutamine phosphoribosylpyrophosphate amidotransferase
MKLGSDKVFITESWVSEDPVLDKSHFYGFELPAGTWFVAMKVQDDNVWKMIKDKSLTGFSVEGLFAEKSMFSKEDKQINQIRTLINQITDYDK